MFLSNQGVSLTNSDREALKHSLDATLHGCDRPPRIETRFGLSGIQRWNVDTKEGNNEHTTNRFSSGATQDARLSHDDLLTCAIGHQRAGRGPIAASTVWGGVIQLEYE